MSRSNKSIGRRDFIRVVSGTLVAAELGSLGCGDAEPSAPGSPPSGDLAVPAGPDPTAAPASPTDVASGMPSAGSPGASAGSAGAASEPPITDDLATAGSAAEPVPPDSMPATAGSPAVPNVPVSDGKSRVYIVKTNNRSEGISQVLAMFGGLGFAAGRDVVVKPNFNSQYAFPATTHEDTIRTIAAELRAVGAGNITLADSAGATTFSSTPTATVIQAKGTVSLCAEVGIDWKSFDDSDVEWETFEFDGMTWSGGLAIPKMMRSDRVKILLPCCKTHTLADYTFSLKLAAGLPPRSRRGIISDMHTSIHQKVVDINKGFTPDLVLMDAMSCFIDNGPDTGTVRDPGLIVASTDRVALDAVGVAILKAAGSVSRPIQGKIFATPQIARAVEIGLGATSPDAIELIGSDDATLSELRSILDVG
jgi:uncharacterized protein (DUF362 family)